MLELIEVLFLGREDEFLSEFKSSGLTFTGTCIVKIKHVLLDLECKLSTPMPERRKKWIHEDLSVDNSDVTLLLVQWNCTALGKRQLAL